MPQEFVNSSIALLYILPSLIVPQCLDLALRLVLCKRLKLLESGDNVRFCTNRQHKAISRVVVDECDPIPEPREGAIGNFVNIRVDQFQGARSAPAAASERICVHLASKAWFTDRIWHSFDIKLHASDHISLNERFHISEVVMGESAMPERHVEWKSGSWVRKLCNRLCHTVQERSIVVIDGGDEEWWSSRASKRHVGCIDIHNEG